MSIHPDDIQRVKGQGFLNNKGTDCFNARIGFANAEKEILSDDILARKEQILKG